MVRRIKILQVLLLTLCSLVVVAQEKIKGVSPCVDSIVNTLQTNTVYLPVKVKVTERKVVLKGGNVRDTFRQEKVLSWTEMVEEDSVKAYKIKNAENTWDYLNNCVSFKNRSSYWNLNFDPVFKNS